MTTRTSHLGESTQSVHAVLISQNGVTQSRNGASNCPGGVSFQSDDFVRTNKGKQKRYFNMVTVTNPLNSQENSLTHPADRKIKESLHMW